MTLVLAAKSHLYLGVKFFKFLLNQLNVIIIYIIGHNYHGLYSHGHKFSRT